MPPKRKTAAKGAPAPPKAAPAPPKATPLAPVQNNIPKPPTPAVKQPAPPPPPPPPPPPVETPSDKVRKEWQNFISTWYEPEKKKLVDQLTKELDAKYKKSNSRIHQAARNADKEKKLTEIATQLAEPAHEEWNNRLAAVQLLVDDWTDITDQEQQSVIDVFSAFYDDNEEDDDSNPFDSNETEESVASAVEEPQLPDSSPFFTIRQSPPTPVSANFQLVNPSSFFTDSISSANQARKLPELAMDNLATLNNLNTGRSQPDAGPSTSAVFGFQSWASEIGLAVPPAAISQPTRNRATDNISRQASASAASSPLFSSTTAPHHSPPSKISPLAVTNNLPPGKRYIGPVIAEEEAEPIDEDLLKAKMAADFLAFKMEVRIQMIQQFHAKASAIEIDLVKQLESNNSSRECRLRTMHEHEENMMSLRESKEMERKKLCDKERDRRLQEHSFRQQVAAQKAINQTRLNASASSSKIPPATQTGWTTHSAPKLASQKENLSTGSLPTKLDPPSILKKSASARSHDIIPGFDEAAFFKAQAEAASLAKGKQPAATATAFPSIPLGRPSALKKTESTSSQEELVEPVVPAPPPTAQSTKGKKAKKAPAVTQTSKTVTFNEEPDTDAEPPPVWGAKGARASLASKPSKSVMIEEEPDEDADPFSAWNAKNARATMPAPASASSKKGKAAVLEEVFDEPSPPVPSAFGWGSAAATTTKKGKAPVVSAEPVEEPFQTWTAPTKKGKAPIVSAEPTEESFQTWTAPTKKGKAPIISAEPVEDPFQTWTAPTWGSASTKKPKVTVTEEFDEEAGPSLAWGAGLKSASSASKQAKKAVPQPEPPRSVQSSFSKTAWVQDVGEEEEEEEEGEEEEGWDQIQPSSATDTTGEEGDAWGAAYWGNLTNGQPVSQVADESAQHMRWTPSMDAEESGDEDSGDMEESMGSALWMQYAISGGDVPGFEAQAPDPQEHAHAHAHVPVKTTPAPSHKKTVNDPTTSIWEQGKGKKKIAPPNETIKVETTRAQQASASSSARTAQWPKAKMEMENWASRLGQSSGSARHL